MRTEAEIQAQMETEAQLRWPDAGVQETTVLSNLVIGVPANSISIFEARLEYFNLSSSAPGFRYLLSASDNDLLPYATAFDYDTITQMRTRISNDLDIWASSFRLSRVPATYARGVVIVVYGDGSTKTVYAGSSVYTDSPNTVYFQVTDTVSATPSLEFGEYRLRVFVEAQVAGAAANVSAEAIVNSSGLTGSINVYNPSNITGGLDAESDLTFFNRVVEWLGGFALGTRQGVVNYLKAAGVQDCVVTTPYDVNRRRASGIDAWCIGEEYHSVTDTVVWAASYAILGYKTIYQPLDTDSSTFIFAGPGGPFTPTFAVVKDVNTGNGGSIIGEDKVIITFLAGPTPVIGTSYSLTYAYNYRIGALQTLFESPNPELWVDLLIKEAIKDDLIVDIVIRVFAGYDVDVVLANVTTALLNLVNTTLLGASLQSSDVIVAAGNIAGVDSVTLAIFDLLSASVYVVQPDITAAFNEFLYLDSTNLTVREGT